MTSHATAETFCKICQRSHPVPRNAAHQAALECSAVWYFADTARDTHTRNVAVEILEWLNFDTSLDDVQVDIKGVAAIIARVSPASAAPVVDGIAWTALLAVLERLKSKTRNPDAEWYHGWNAAIQCLINDINARSTAAATAAPVEQQTFKNTKEAMLYAQRNNIPAVVPGGEPSTSARAAAEEIAQWVKYEGCVDGEAVNEVAAIIERHCFSAAGSETQ